MNSDDKSKASLSLAEAMHLHAIEGMPLSADQVAVFERFTREGWDHDRRIADIIARHTAPEARAAE